MLRELNPTDRKVVETVLNALSSGTTDAQQETREAKAAEKEHFQATFGADFISTIQDLAEEQAAEETEPPGGDKKLPRRKLSRNKRKLSSQSTNGKESSAANNGHARKSR